MRRLLPWRRRKQRLLEERLERIEKEREEREASRRNEARMKTLCHLGYDAMTSMEVTNQKLREISDRLKALAEGKTERERVECERINAATDSVNVWFKENVPGIVINQPGRFEKEDGNTP